MKKSFLGYSKFYNIPLPFKIFIFIFFSTITFLNISIYIKITIVVFLIIFRFIILGIKKSIKLYIFLIISSIMIFLFWIIFEEKNLFINITNAIIRLWLLFLSGNVFLLITTQDELIYYMKKWKISLEIILFIIISINSLSYFMDAFKEILKSYNARSNDKNLFKKCTYVLKVMSIDCLFLIVECKKIYTLYYNNIMSALKGENNYAKC